MNSETIQGPLPIFRGSICNACYTDQLVGRYKQNPVIEALPPILSPKDAAKLLGYYPEREPNWHKLPPEIRLHLIMDAVHFFEPLPVHLDLEQRISRVIRDSYTGRNPLARDYWSDIDRRVQRITGEGAIPFRSSTVNGFSIIGTPGVGKTTAVERILLTYPQVIHHQMYKGQPFNRVQLAWWKLTCPHDGSIKGLCLEFFKEIDSVLGTTHHRDYAGGGRRTVDELIPAICRVSWIHCLGLLVIDEIQHLNQASGGPERMLGFFLQLMNTLGVPIILIGTNGAMNLLTRELRHIRRGCGQGDLIWDPMPYDEAWSLFVESLWRFQYTKIQVPLTEELSKAIHEESVGIIDFAVKLFLLAQVRAISTGIEKITPAIIHSVAKDSLRSAQPALHAIRTGDMRAVATMTDLHPIDFESAVQQMRKAALLRELSSGSQIASKINTNATSPARSDSLVNPDTAAQPAGTAPALADRPAKKRRRSTRASAASNCKLVQVVNTGLAKNMSAHVSLTKAGFIKPLFQGREAQRLT